MKKIAILIMIMAIGSVANADMFGTEGYQSVALSESQVESVESVVTNFVSANMGENVDEQRVRLPKIKKQGLQSCVDYVQKNLPNGVERVDGASIRPLLDKVVSARIKALPIQEPTEEM